MKIDFTGYKFYLRPGITDMRKHSFQLSLIVEDLMKLNAFDKAVFVFCGSERKIIRAIVWDKNGFVEISKRIVSKGRYRWPMTQEEAMEITPEAMSLLLQGCDVTTRLPEIHPKYVG